MYKNDFVYDPNWAKTGFDVKDGDHRVKIVSVNDETSKQGKAMIHLQYKVEGATELYDDFIVEGEYFDRSASRIFDVFKIMPGDWKYLHWMNKIAYAHFEHVEEKYTDRNGNPRTALKAKLRYFHNNVPPVAPSASQSVVQNSYLQTPQTTSEDIPF